LGACEALSRSVLLLLRGQSPADQRHQPKTCEVCDRVATATICDRVATTLPGPERI